MLGIEEHASLPVLKEADEGIAAIGQKASEGEHHHFRLLELEDEAAVANAELENGCTVVVGRPLDAKANDELAVTVDTFAFEPGNIFNPSTDDEGIRGEGDVNVVPLIEVDPKPLEFVRVWGVDCFDGYVLVVHNGCRQQVLGFEVIFLICKSKCIREADHIWKRRLLRHTVK